MITIQAAGVSGGVAVGPLHFFRRPGETVVKTSAQDPEGEKARLAAALGKSAAQLKGLAEDCRQRGNEEAAALFDTHAMLAEDEDFIACIREILEGEGCTAQYAVQQAGERFAALFADLDDPYLSARAADIRDIARRILDNLMGNVEGGIDSDLPVILAADDLTPSETIRLDKTKILGLVTRGGSAVSHTAILARTMGIPAICGLGDALKEVYTGQLCCMDGETGLLVIGPDEAALHAVEEKRAGLAQEKQRLEHLKGQEDVTRDGRRIRICCNINSPEETADVLAAGGRGVGLFRTEFLFMRENRFPGEEEQFEAYRAVVSAMEGERVVIRTLDLGADKQGDIPTGREENPALGMRGVRLCLSRPDLFKTQLRAIYRASAWGRVAILFPMITSLWEVRACKALCREVMAELDIQGLPYDRNAEMGIMIETPAAALVADVLAREVDFFSVGTNDLAQYILACDRRANGLERFFDPRHPAVLRAVKMAADAAHAAGIPIGICGELAGDVELLSTFLAMGIDELSVTPSAVLSLRAALRQSIAGSCTLDLLNYG